MDIFQALASTTDNTDFVTVTGFSMHDFANYGKFLSIEWIGAPFVFVLHNGIKVIGFIAFIVIISFIINLFNVSFRGTRPARR
jgi:hypothetical protein